MSMSATLSNRLRTSTFEALVFKATARLLQGVPERKLQEELSADGRVQYELGDTRADDPILALIINKAKESL